MKKMSDKRKRLLLSILALAEIIALFAGITFSWVEGGGRSSINGEAIQVTTGSDLSMLYEGKNTNTVQIPFCELEETSSEDGRNFFFPMKDNTSSSTPEMKFREGTPQDVNKKYISLDFQLVAAGELSADVYLGAGTIIQSKKKELLSALRMSISMNDGSTPIVFKPNQMPGAQSVQYSPIVAVSSSGVPTQGTKHTKAYGDYYYSGSGENSNKLFHLDAGETKNITLSLWLEGTEFSGNDIQNTDLSVYVDFTTQHDNLVQYKFVDNTHTRDTALYSHWVSNKSSADDETMMYIFDKTTNRYYALKNTEEHTWVGYIPDSVTNFYFRRYSIDVDTWWNEWEPDMSDIKTASDGIHTFVAIAGQEKSSGANLDGCYGYWKDSVGTYRVYFNNEAGWSSVKCYTWSSSGYTGLTGPRPGKAMTRIGNSNIYFVDLNETVKVIGIQFNSGNSSNEINITDSQYFFNGMIFKYNGTSTRSYSIYTAEQESLIYPHK